MATIILAKDGIPLQELTLLKTRITIGRRTYNDIVIDAPGISAEHAVIITTDTESYFEDLGSTNGSRMNGQPVKKHVLQGRDVIELATHTIQYCANESVYEVVAGPVFSSGVSTNSVIQDSNQQPNDSTQVDSAFDASASSPAIIKILSGAGKDKEIPLNKALTTIGRPGVQVAVLTSAPDGYSITHVEGYVHPRVNGVVIGLKTQALKSGDVIGLSGTEMMFLC
ncbi:MAG: FHA domain-containing protein [Herminiimonas sp.]|uniref:FHA domain-containing protein n=1 Tax=Herminiimonas sp. TaxID=1926289 RepID=UPI00271DB67E|nr:FHA domain-containing protein [Herminiimonas sp.]MDO9422198.1 FHA domain-containing protein [Herminiimonas sp.]